MATYLSRTFTADNTSRSIFTVSAWIKRSVLSSAQTVISASTTSNFNDKIIGFRSDNTLEVNNVASGSAAIEVITNRVFRDPGAWYHIVVAIDTTQSAIADGVKLYVNGVRDTDFSGSPTYTQSATFEIGRNGSATAIGRYESGSSQYFGGYIADVHYIDGQQKLPTDFGETDSTTGEWKPKSYAGTYGNNGFLLEFKNAGALGTDTSGNSETFTVNGAGTGAQVTDTPSNLFCTMSPIDKGSNAGTLTLGNLKMTNGTSGSADNQKFRGTMAVTKGKWYFEMKKLANTASIGLLATEEKINQTSASGMLVEYLHQGELRFWNGSSRVTKTTGVNSYTTNDIVGCALDMDNRRAYFHKNGVYQGDPTPDPASSPSGAGQMAAIQTGFTMSPCFMDDTTASAGEAAMNFGNPPFTISSNSGNGNADANGYGKFEYAVPSGYYALCTKNLAQYG